ncbi:DUF2795 domain-containing protein [Dehalogenimonas sp. 4OHTPN]|uniref:DUF2795 domain-containing protein n=1 Tax=Dehalogenimonas sp. 4OHTPN TaxID=3166643 RepID=A0AAU8G897_9CHLR
MTMILDRAQTKEITAPPGFHRCLDMSVADLETCLDGISYPATKHDLVRHAHRNGAKPDILAFLHLLPENKYPQFHDIAFMAWSFLLV